MDILVQMEQRDSGIILVRIFPQIFISEGGFENGENWGKTSVLGKKKSWNLTISGLSGGDKRDRTADLLNAIQALSQLSYTPELPYFG